MVYGGGFLTGFPIRFLTEFPVINLKASLDAIGDRHQPVLQFQPLRGAQRPHPRRPPNMYRTASFVSDIRSKLPVSSFRSRLAAPSFALGIPKHMPGSHSINSLFVRPGSDLVLQTKPDGIAAALVSQTLPRAPLGCRGVGDLLTGC